jgi:hypothetical protein
LSKVALEYDHRLLNFLLHMQTSTMALCSGARKVRSRKSFERVSWLSRVSGLREIDASRRLPVSQLTGAPTALTIALVLIMLNDERPLSDVILGDRSKVFRLPIAEQANADACFSIMGAHPIVSSMAFWTV